MRGMGRRITPPARERVANDSGRGGARRRGTRLAAITGDVAGLRRALVDEGLLTRTADGSAYAPP